MIRLQEQLCEDWMRSRLSIPTLPTNLKKHIEDSLGIKDTVQLQSQETEEETSINKRKICTFCNYKKRRMTKTQCATCKKHICGEHQIVTCPICNVK